MARIHEFERFREHRANHRGRRCRDFACLSFSTDSGEHKGRECAGSARNFRVCIADFNISGRTCGQIRQVGGRGELTEGDRRFQYWSHVQFLLHAETYFHHHQLGLMPDEHWRGYSKFMTRYVASPGFKVTWDDIGSAFSENFARWVNSLVNQGQKQ
jgi:hypothetical protein